MKKSFKKYLKLEKKLFPLVCQKRKNIHGSFMGVRFVWSGYSLHPSFADLSIYECDNKRNHLGEKDGLPYSRPR